MIWIVAAIVVVAAICYSVFSPFKQNPYEYVSDESGIEYVKDNTDQ